MSFTCPEFPGRVFESVEELQSLREEKQKLCDKLTGRTKAKIAKTEGAKRPNGLQKSD